MHPQQAATPTPPKPQASEEWERALADVMAGGQGASAKLAILSLTHIRDKIGDAEFTRVQRRVHLAVQTVIGKLLGSGDKLFRIGEETYVVIVGSMDIDKAQTLIQQGCTTLAKMFFGQEEYGDIMVKAEVTEIVTEAWSPLGQGGALAHPVIAAIAAKHGRSPERLDTDQQNATG